MALFSPCAAKQWIAQLKSLLATRPPVFTLVQRYPNLQIIFRATAWLLAFAIIVLSLVPAPARPVTPAGHGLEHFSIFVANGLAFGLGYSRRPLFVILAMPVFAALVETMQLFVPGRHARISDFVIDAMAACVGGLLGTFALHISALSIRR
jgi:VanZ family protein